MAPIIALGIWWNSNTVSHYFIHKPFFKVRALNRLFSAYLTVLLGIPQSLWRDRHVAHHAGVAWRLRISPQRVIEVFLVVGLWSLLLTAEPLFFFKTYLPGYLIGLGLCALHGYYEHAQGAISHYGAIYNFLFFNDGYHVEHHGDPHTHWSQLPQRLNPTAQNSQWPAILRCLELEPRRLPERKSKAENRKSKVQGPAQLLNFCQRLALQELERLVLHSQRLQFFLLQSHKQAFYFLLSTLPPVRRVGIVGGGLFPRTVLILRELLPQARLSVIDASYENLQIARRYLKLRDQSDPLSATGHDPAVEKRCSASLHGQSSEFLPEKQDAAGLPRSPFEKDIEIINEPYDPGRHHNFDLLVIPLSFAGDRSAIYDRPPAPSVLIHDWIWRQVGTSRIVSVFLLKRLNLLRQSQSL
ncbi:MAG TPA: fatty acid desaturase [Acidobacteriota bacterium]|nr:fatty acid desaturase [Acidobacteriota bacterium]